MDRGNEVAMTVLVGSAGALVLLGLWVSPFDLGLVESALLAAGFVAFGVFQLVLQDTTFGAQ